jgi:hypothetical protein
MPPEVFEIVVNKTNKGLELSLPFAPALPWSQLTPSPKIVLFPSAFKASYYRPLPFAFAHLPGAFSVGLLPDQPLRGAH